MTRQPGKPYASPAAGTAWTSTSGAASRASREAERALERSSAVGLGEFGLPAAEAWATGYGTYTRVLPHLREVRFDEALALVKAMLDPVLAGRREGTWRPETRRWEPDDADRERAAGGCGQSVEGKDSGGGT